MKRSLVTHGLGVRVALTFGLAVLALPAAAQTDGSATLRTTLLDYNGSGTRHYTVVWVTTGSGQFIKSLRKQGPSNWSSSEWRNHCGTWNTARAGSTVLDGYSSATAANYSGTNSPVIVTWNCRDASDALMPDGNYKFWVQYAENSGQGPVTTDGLLWAKGAVGATNTYQNQGANFANMSVTWSPAAPPAVAPAITSAPPTGSGTVGVPYSFTVVATGTAPITFSASGLPAGLAIDSTSGLIAGSPTTAGTFGGTVTAANGTPPNATQNFSITIAAPVPVDIGAVDLSGGDLALGGTGPANATYEVVAASDPGLPLAQWTVVETGTIDADGNFTATIAVPTEGMGHYYLLRTL